MKTNVWLFSTMAALIAATAVAQDASPAAAPTSTSPESAAKPKEKTPTAIKSRVEINPPATALVKGNVVNVRGQPSFNGEVLGHLQTGETATALEEIILSHPPSGEPPKWYKIVMPTNIPVWVKIDYIDPTTKSVKARRVNLRGGPGENYSVVGRLEKGATITEVRDEKGWVAIEAPTNAFAFVAAGLLEIQAAAAPAPVAAAPTPPPEAATPVAPVPTAPPPSTTEPPPAAPAPPTQAETAQELAALRQATATEPGTNAAGAATEPATPRVVTREGFVHKSYNIQSPADFELHDIRSGALTEYLQPQAQQNFKIYVGTRVTVSGPEVVDTRWPRTPVLQVQTVELMP
jgi:uncharacterized protein YgiM (DUF1202 family)